MKSILLHITKGLGIFALCLVIAVSSLAAVYSIPTKPIQENVAQSAELFEKEGNYPIWHRWCRSIMDNDTDCLMCLVAEYKSDNSVFVDAMEANYPVLEGTSTVETLVYHHINGNDYPEFIDYSRYWHGYLVFIKPLLTVFNYRQIRIVNSVTLVLLVCILFFLLFKRKRELVIPYAITILIAGPAIIMNSLQYSQCFYMIIISSCFLLLLEKCKNFSAKGLYILLLTGIGTAFFDLLTYPIATYCIPATLYLYMTPKGSWKDTLVKIVKTGAVWACGFFGFWASKWMVGSLILNRNIVGGAFDAAQMRTSNSGIVSMLLTIGYNVCEICLTPFMLLAVAFFLYAIVKTVKSRTKESPGFKTVCVRFLLPYSIISVLPLLWYAVLQNHSYAHHFFTHKAMLGTVFALLVLATDLYRNDNQKFDVSPKNIM